MTDDIVSIGGGAFVRRSDVVAITTTAEHAGIIILRSQSRIQTQIDSETLFQRLFAHAHESTPTEDISIKIAQAVSAHLQAIVDWLNTLSDVPAELARNRAVATCIVRGDYRKQMKDAP